MIYILFYPQQDILLLCPSPSLDFLLQFSSIAATTSFSQIELNSRRSIEMMNIIHHAYMISSLSYHTPYNTCSAITCTIVEYQALYSLPVTAVINGQDCSDVSVCSIIPMFSKQCLSNPGDCLEESRRVPLMFVA